MILDFLYCGMANIYQENSDSSLTIAEELQQDLIETLTMENRVPNISEAIFKKYQCVSKSLVIPCNANNFAVGKPNDISGDIKKLDARTKDVG